jgi:hypothetical protein
MAGGSHRSGGTGCRRINCRNGHPFGRTYVVLAVLLLTPLSALAQSTEYLYPLVDLPSAPPLLVRAEDVPDDTGNRLALSWTRSLDDGNGQNNVVSYTIQRKEVPNPESGEGAETDFAVVDEVGAGTSSYTDSTCEPDHTYVYIVAASNGVALSYSRPSEPATARSHFFHSQRWNTLIGIVLLTLLLVYFIYSARKGKELFIRRIAGLDAVEEALGRATEMGKPILYVSGLSTMADVATIAAVNILGQVARKAAIYEIRLIVPCYDPIVMAVEREVVKEAYLDSGRPDAYNPNDIYFVTQSQFAYAAAINGIMLREKPATNFYMGMFFAESLILAETGASTGAIQIAGTDAVVQIPFFITACDYCIMGEELYAASAYMSREPLLLGGLKGQDWAKFIIGVLIVIGVITSFFTTWFSDMFIVG